MDTAKINDIKEWNQLEALLLDTAKIKDIKEWNQLEALLLDTDKIKDIKECDQLEALLLDTAKISIYKLSKARARRTRDLTDNVYINDSYSDGCRRDQGDMGIIL